MANQKMWNRNYDNLFSIAYGWKSGCWNESTPKENVPLLRIADGGGYYTYDASRNTIENGLAAASTSLNKINTYLTSASTTLTWGTYSYSTLNGFTSGWGICLGSGDEPPVYDGYNLLTPIYDNMNLGTVSIISSSYDENTHTYSFGYKVPITYSGSSNIVINEYGLYVPLLSDYHYLRGKAVMIYHEVFESGITLQQNDTIEITITQSIVQPNYTPYPSTE